MKVEPNDKQAIKWSIYSSLISKVLTIGIQFISFPLAISALGIERFGVYVLITSSLAFFNLGSLGIFPGLTRDVAKYVDDKATVAEYLFTSVKIVSFLSAIIIGVYFVIVNLFSMDQLFGNGLNDFSDEAAGALDIALLFIILNLLGGCAEATWLGMGKQYITNSINIIANIISFFLILYTAKVNPTIMMLVISINGSLAISKVLNLILLVYTLSKGVINDFRNFIYANRYQALLSVGLLCFTGELATIATTQGILYMIGYSSGPEDVAYMSFIFRFLALSGGSIIMITQPLSAAFMKWNHRQDYNHIINSIHKVYSSIALFSIFVSIGIVFIGKEFFILWSKGEVVFGFDILCVISLLFFVGVWNHLIHSYMFSVGMTKRPLVISLIESIFTILFVYLFAIGQGVVYYTACILISAVVGKSIFYTYIFVNSYIKMKNLIIKN